jgi:hypothetical protein
VHYRNDLPTVLVASVGYLGLVFFIHSLYIQTCTDFILPASLFPLITLLPHPAILNLLDLGSSFVDRYQYFGRDNCISHPEYSFRFIQYIDIDQTTWHDIPAGCNLRNLKSFRNAMVLEYDTGLSFSR